MSGLFLALCDSPGVVPGSGRLVRVALVAGDSGQAQVWWCFPGVRDGPRKPFVSTVKGGHFYFEGVFPQ